MFTPVFTHFLPKKKTVAGVHRRRRGVQPRVAQTDCLQPGEALAAVCKGATFARMQRAPRKDTYLISACAFSL
jgi:hypothetical protein